MKTYQTRSLQHVRHDFKKKIKQQKQEWERERERELCDKINSECGVQPVGLLIYLLRSIVIGCPISFPLIGSETAATTQIVTLIYRQVRLQLLWWRIFSFFFSAQLVCGNSGLFVCGVNPARECANSYLQNRCLNKSKQTSQVLLQWDKRMKGEGNTKEPVWLGVQFSKHNNWKSLLK